MEQYHFPRRSRSHGTLRNDYVHRGRPLNKPLGRVSENTALLYSAGALEGMLKTTTETGDIGLFSIKSVPGTALVLPSGGRSHTRSKYPPRPLRQSINQPHRYENQKKLHSSRDTASEIISMYGSNSQSSVTSTLATSMDEPGQRSYTMTTIGSRHLPHNKSNATLQSQASSGTLQRPRSPFPYPTRLKRPGARPVSPAVTEAGIVDYSRMVEIDRISLVSQPETFANSCTCIDISAMKRTGYEPIKSSYPHSHRRVLPLGLRPYASLSTPPMRRPPPPPSPRTTSAASIAAWSAGNPPFLDRVNSPSSRASSLTSVVNMYYRMPPALKVAQFGPVVPSPGYYDYTEEFENKKSPPVPEVQPVAPIPMRSSSKEHPLVLREDSGEQSATTFGRTEHAESLDMGDSRQEDSLVDTEPHLLSELEVDGEIGGKIQGSSQVKSASESSSAREQNTSAIPGLLLGPRRFTGGSAIDLLPSQIDRASVDTFRPSLDIDSKEIPLFSYPKFRQSTYKQTSTPSPARQVQVHGGKTPTIKSEQGVILREDDSDKSADIDHDNKVDCSPSAVEGSTVSIQSATKWHSNSKPAGGLVRITSSSQSNLSMSRRQAAMSDPFKSYCLRLKSISKQETLNNDFNKEKYQDILVPQAERLRPALPPKAVGCVPSTPSRLQESWESTGWSTQNQRVTTRNDTGREKDPQQLQTPAMRIKCLPKDNESSPQLTPCSMTPLIAPKPISPVRELKVKNSIPQLMKALPPLPAHSEYVLPPSPMKPDRDEDKFVEILKPQTSLDGLTVPKRPKIPRTLFSKPLPDIQKKLPRIRIKSQGQDSVLKSSNRDSRPWNSDSNYPWCDDAPDIDLANIQLEDNSRTSFKLNLRLRRSRNIGCGSPIGSVRRHPECRSEPVTELIGEHSRELFDHSKGLSAAFRQVGRKFRQGSTDTTSKHRSFSTSNTRACSSLVREPSRTPLNLVTGPDAKHRIRVCKSNAYEAFKQHKGLKKRISNLQWLLAHDIRAKPSDGPAEEMELLTGKRQAGLESIFEMSKVEFESKASMPCENLTTSSESRPRFKRRIKAKISKWVRETKSAFMYSRTGPAALNSCDARKTTVVS